MSGSASIVSPRSSTSSPLTSRVISTVKQAITKPSWATFDGEDEEEEGNDKSKHTRPQKSQEDYNEKDSFLPESPAPSKISTKETRHWTPSTARHVIITPEMLNQQQNLDDPYDPNPFNDPDLEKADDPIRRDSPVVLRSSHRRKQKFLTKMTLIILNKGYVPLILRLISFIFSLAALILAGYITRTSVRTGVQTRPSTVLAFVVNASALFYLPYVAKDEYFGRAIGVRSPKHKLRLILMDLLFIILNSADLALAFNVLYDSAAGCLTDPTFGPDDAGSRQVCRLQQGMAGALFITLMGFLINFTVSLYRLVERIITSAD